MGKDEETESIKRWIARRKSALILSILKGETSIAEAARKHGLTVAEVERWREKFLFGAENSLRSRPRDETAQTAKYVKRLERKVGQMSLDMDISLCLLTLELKHLGHELEEGEAALRQVICAGQ